jgi:Holliday junction resolvasome RuvABC ATP-dependent DNA helicase subunit
MDLNFIQRIGNTVTIESLPEILNEINKSEKSSLFFIDEIDGMESVMIKMLNPIIESFQISGRKIKPFLFASATINKNILVKNNPDTLDRIKHAINFTRYTIDELMQIAEQVHQQLYKEETISQDVLKALAENCKLNPRTIINLLENYIVCPDVKKVLKVSGIVKDGLTWSDVKVLNFLNECPKPVGSNVIAMKCALSQREYEYEIEPSLFEFGFLNRTPSRVITTKGKEFLQSIKEN